MPSRHSRPKEPRQVKKHRGGENHGIQPVDQPAVALNVMAPVFHPLSRLIADITRNPASPMSEITSDISADCQNENGVSHQSDPPTSVAKRDAA